METEVKDRPRVGLVLSGGGARGLAHIGVLKALARNEVPIDLVAGTSMGGLIAAVLAAGWEPGEMEAEAVRMRQLRRRVNLVDRAVPRTGLVQGRRVHDYLVEQLGDITFAELRLPLALLAVDLVDGREVLLNDGSVVDAVRATISIPGVFAPVRRDGQTLVDGGVLNNLPVDIACQMGADVVIAVDVSRRSNHVLQSPAAGSSRLPIRDWASGVASLQRSLELMMAHITRFRLENARPDVLIEPALPDNLTVLGGFGRVDEAIAAGEAAAEGQSAQIKALCAPAGPGTSKPTQGKTAIET